MKLCNCTLCERHTGLCTDPWSGDQAMFCGCGRDGCRPDSVAMGGAFEQGRLRAALGNLYTWAITESGREENECSSVLIDQKTGSVKASIDWAEIRSILGAPIFEETP